MHAPEQRDESSDCGCPLCAIWSAYKNSEAAEHLRGIQRETLLLVRCLLDASIKRGGEYLSGKGTQTEDRK